MTTEFSGITAVLALIGVIAFVILVIVAVAIGARKERERTAALRARAAELGLRFVELDAELAAGLATKMAAFPPFCVGHSRRGMNLIEGQFVAGGLRMSLMFGDYQYKVTTSNGKSTTTTTFNMSFISVVPVLAINEELTVREEGFFDKIGQFIGFEDIDFESSEFSKRFHVKCSDRRFAFDLFDPRMIEYFLAAQPPRIHARDGRLLFDRGVQRWKIEEFTANLAWMDGFFARVPRHVRAARLAQSDHAADPVLHPTSGDLQ